MKRLPNEHPMSEEPDMGKEYLVRSGSRVRVYKRSGMNDWEYCAAASGGDGWCYLTDVLVETDE